MRTRGEYRIPQLENEQDFHMQYRKKKSMTLGGNV
jgi:hypothetical protein